MSEALESPAATRHLQSEPPGRLSRWLQLAGYRRSRASFTFVSVTAVFVVIGSVSAVLLAQSPLLRDMRESVLSLPGFAGEASAEILSVSPWMIIAILGSIPIVIVRSSRRRRVIDIEQDLPITLELLSTLVEAGLSFDAALSKILESHPGSRRPLSMELRTFQLELLAGLPRLRCLRQLAYRIEVASISIFVSALVQAEQVGASVADTLRRQADDLRERRRERVMLLAQGLPAKLVFPLVICFLPGLFLSTMGPTLMQLVEVADSVIRGAR
jgi:tight adherence protein C